ncbi:MAG: hypothetical protein D3920_06730 [Candidatus Electrothrix sp. AW2]|nr:hypothetical protein [Candidatus Electrothrix gigas]
MIFSSPLDIPYPFAPNFLDILQNKKCLLKLDPILQIHLYKYIVLDSINNFALGLSGTDILLGSQLSTSCKLLGYRLGSKKVSG